MKKNQTYALKLPLLDSTPSDSDHSQQAKSSSRNNSLSSNENSRYMAEFETIEIPEKSNLILLSSSLSIELYFLICLIPCTPIFEYCKVKFFFNYIEQIKTIPQYDSTKYYYSNTNCEEIIEASCENICLLAHRIDSYTYLLFLSATAKILLSTLSCILLSIKCIKRETLNTRKTLFLCESSAFLLSLIGIFSFLYSLNDSTLSNTKDQQIPFSFGPSAYLTCAVLLFSLISRAFIFISLNPKALPNQIT